MAVVTILSAFIDNGNSSSDPKINLPYKKMGLTKEQAAAHLLSRFSFGARPGQIKELVNMGLDKWLQQQLEGNLPEEEVVRRLPAEKYDALAMNNEIIVNTYLNAGQIFRMAAKNNWLDKGSVQNSDKPEYRAQIKKLME